MSTKRAKPFLSLAAWALSSALFFAGCAAPVKSVDAPARWVTAWTTAPLTETTGKTPPALAEATLRQTVMVNASGDSIRLRFGNYFGQEPLVIGGARVALAENTDASDATATQRLRFGGSETVSVPAGADIVSDPVPLAVRAGAKLTVALYLRAVPRTLTVHTASRSQAFLTPGNSLDAARPRDAAPSFTSWYFLCGVDVQTRDAHAVAILGDSIADGYGIAPDSYARWPDALARRLRANPATANVAVLNLGIGGNRLLRDGFGPRALDRVERDIFKQHGVRWLVLSLGINDIGTRLDARKKGASYASAEDIIGALRTLATQARERGIKPIGATITPYAGAGFYWSEDGEADRATVNAWIRTTEVFDAVIDFDAALRDPQTPSRLAPAFDSGDHLHPSTAGYAEMARIIDLALFAR